MKTTQTSTQAIDFKTLFQTLPERYVVIDADVPLFTMRAANEAYLEVTGKRMKEIIGKSMLEVFPDTSPLAIKTGKGELQRSLERVIQTKEPDHTGVIRYDIPDKKGVLRLRYWQATHYPVIDDEGKVVSIVQNTSDVTDMVLASERQKITESQFEEILSTGLVGTWRWDMTLDKVYADKGFAKILGLTQAELQDGVSSDYIFHAIDESDQPRVRKTLDESIRNKQVFEAEYRTRGTQASVRWVLARGHITREASGEATSLTGVVFDITDRKNTEYELKLSERRLRFMADTMPQLVWIARPDGYHEYYNARWYEFTGAEKGGTSYDDRNAMVHPDDKARARHQWEYSLKRGTPYEIEYRLYHVATDSYRWVIVRAMPFHDENGELIKWYGTCTDIDEQKRASQVQEFLGDISKQLAMTLNIDTTLKHIATLAVPVLGDWCSFELLDEKSQTIRQISVAHKDPKKVSIAKRFRDMAPVTLDQPTGVAKVIRTGEPEFYPVITKELIEHSVENEEIKQFLFDIDMRSTMTVPLFIKNMPKGAITFVASDSRRYFNEHDLDIAQDVASRVSAFLTNATLYNESIETIKYRKQLEIQLNDEKERLELRVDERTSQLQLTNEGLRSEIKKRQKAERDLQAFSKELERSNQELQDFAYVSSHDLQEPLRKIRAFGDLLQSEYAETLGDGNMYLERMQNAAGRMSRLIEDLLAFSRVSSKPMTPSPTDLSLVVGEVLNDLETRIKETDAVVETDTLPVVCADNTHMRQLFQNLIGNALKFHQPDVAPHITVTYHPESKMEEIRVHDNGIGFEDEYAEKIFAVFQRLHGKDAYEGTGIGLAVCRKIVERYGGTITAESIKGEGTTFIIRLPKMKGKE